MLFNVYLFSLIFGAVLIVASLLFGGDAEAEVEAAVDADVDIDADATVDPGQQGFTTAHDGAHGHLGGFAGAFLSLRFWTYFLCFGGLAGVLLTHFSAADATTSGGAALVTGLLAGQGTVLLFRLVGKQSASDAHATHDFIGRGARVTVAVDGEVGKIRTSLHGDTHDFIARPHRDGVIPTGTAVMIVGFDGPTAIVEVEDAARAPHPTRELTS